MATTSKRTTPKSEKKKVTSAKNWKSSTRHPVELELPSGNVCLAVNKGMRVFLEEGKVPNNLMEIVMSAIEGAENKKGLQSKIDEATKDPKMIGDMLRLMDVILATCVIEPVIMAVPTKVIDDKGTEAPDESAKDPDVLYVDDVDLEDKIFIFQWCVGGTDSVEQFRSEHSSIMGDVQIGSGVEQKAE